MTELTSAVRDAQADADRRFGDSPVQPWEPPPVLSAATRRRLAIVALASLLATALMVAMSVAKTAAAPGEAPAAATIEPARPAVDTPEGDAMHDDADNEGPSAQPATAAAPGLALERHGAGWRLSVHGAPRHEVVRRLVEASGSRLHSAPEALADARPLQLQWQGRTLAPVWPIVLGPELSYALQCRRDRCEVWILGLARAAVPLAALGTAPPRGPDSSSAGLPMPMAIADDDTAPGRD